MCETKLSKSLDGIVKFVVNKYLTGHYSVEVKNQYDKDNVTLLEVKISLFPIDLKLSLYSFTYRGTENRILAGRILGGKIISKLSWISGDYASAYLSKFFNNVQKLYDGAWVTFIERQYVTQCRLTGRWVTVSVGRRHEATYVDYNGVFHPLSQPPLEWEEEVCISEDK
jgi:hypothetical protein